VSTDVTARAPGGLVEPLVTFFAATAAASALYWLAHLVPFVQSNLHGGIAIVFLYAPALAARLSGRPFDYHAAGLHLRPAGRTLAVTTIGIGVTWPLFFAAFLVFYSAVCAPHAPALAQFWAETFAPVCPRWLGLSGARLQLPPDFFLLALSQILVVAVPEEMFFRGYLLGRLEERWTSRRLLFGAPVGRALLVSSALFALGHVLVDFDVQRLSVFVPALVFGWMRARTGSIAAGVLFHALCNLFSEILHQSFFR
jgi:membrane protease YdiL (CAAX protease family)